MKASEIKKSLDPQIKKASQTAVNKIKANIKKQNQMKNMTAKKEEKVYVKADSTFDGLKQIVEMKKNKAVANELDGLIFEQDRLKEKREKGDSSEEQKQARTPSPLEVYFAANPDKIKDMSIEEVTKLSMLMSPSGGGSDPLISLMMMGMNKNNDGGDLTQKILGVLVERLLTNNNGNGKKEGGDMEIFKLMMQQNMQTQQMMMGMITKQNALPPENQNNSFMKEIFGMMKGQSDLENSMLREKLHELEMRQNQTDPLGEAKRMLDYVKTFGNAFGSGNQSPEAMKHELDMKNMDYEQNRQAKEGHMRTQRMDQIGGMINNTIETFGKVLGEPMAEAAKAKIEQFAENVKNPLPPEKQKIRISPEKLREEIDLGDLEKLDELEEELQYENPEGEKTRKRFKVAESGK